MSAQRKRRRDHPTELRHPQDQVGRDDESRPSLVPALALEPAHVAAVELREGPIPDARELVRYGYAHPDAPRIILEEFATQGAHRRLMERRAASLDRMAMDAAVRSERLGVACGLFIALVGFGCATYLVAIGHGVEGTVIFGLDVCALVSAFILGRSRPQRGTPASRAI
jgi:hypothetical protein